MRRLIALVIGVAAALPAPAATVLASNVSHPAIYTGVASTGGTVEFEVSADGTAVTRFVLREVSFPPCATGISGTSGQFPIVNDSFNGSFQYGTSAGVQFNGSFPTIQQAQGVMTFYVGSFNCWSQEVPWTASTPTPTPDTTPPDTKIGSGPSGRTSKRKATFRFASTEAGSSFQCKLDGKKWGTCRVPKTYERLKQGRHVFKVKATDAAGNVDPTPAKRSWRVG